MSDNPNTTLNLPPQLEDFLEQLIKEKNFSDAGGQEFIEEVKSELRPLLLKSINYDLFMSLDEEKQTECRQLIESQAPDTQIRDFLSTHIKDQDLVMARTLHNFRKKYLGM